MINYEEAKKIALEKKADINTCREFKQAYHFLNNDSDVDGDNGVVILKENGRALRLTAFILSYHPETDPKEIKF